MTKTYSLRHRLIVWISIPIAIATISALLLSYFFAKHEIEEVYDAQLVHSAKVLQQLTVHEIMQDKDFNLGIENSSLQHRYEQKLGFRIWVDGKIITQSSNTAGFDRFSASPGFSNHHINGHEWRFFVFIDADNNLKIEVSERYDVRYELILQLMISIVIPTLISIPLILLIIWGGVRKVLRPVVKMSAEVDQRGSDDLSPIQDKRLPSEIAPLVLALNRLFVRLEGSFRREREFTDHAAHELRTPLAAMKTQTQVLIKRSKDMPDCLEGLENLQSSINRATHLVGQLLSLARLQHETVMYETLDLSLLLHDCLCDAQPLADEKNIIVKTHIAEQILVHGYAESIGILLGNLLDNAIKYTPEKGQVDVSLTPDGLLRICDTGSGISDKDKECVFKRFVRVDKTGQTGSGLGLAIAEWIAGQHGVRIQLSDNNPHGLCVSIQWSSV